MKTNWSKLLDKYVNKIVSPDGRQTYESKEELVNTILELAELKDTDKVIDIGCGWGNFIETCSRLVNSVIGIEPNLDNLNEAKKRNNSANVEYIQGSFEKLHFNQTADKVVSMLAFHQVPWKEKEKALKNVYDILEKDGYFFLCDTMIMFNPERNPELFDRVYRYILKETTPNEIYTQYIEPYLNDDVIYSVDDMKENTPENNRFYSIEELDSWAEKANLKLINTIEICPFFGVVIFQK
ncbi:MAG TPA: class I SAM-dependent methyltransferase [Christensenellaceae bacterium]|jgi:ubiquinone/menaquinone biosynthesis C-methylase UbiE|nr:class I SAM-dependent methyltransferase [Christensenellaceae bacterium]